MDIDVFIIDDSAVVRQTLTGLLAEARGINVLGSAQDPVYAQQKMQKAWPDVIVLDVEMPRMDGITYLKKIMAERPTPVVMCSTLTEEGSITSLKALRIGAVDVIAKPKSSLKTSLKEAGRELINAIKIAAKANIKNTRPKPVSISFEITQKHCADVILDKGRAVVADGNYPVIAIGASTGGTQALELLLKALPANSLPILIVQHMPEHFTKAFANRLNEVCRLEVKEAEDNDALLPGRVLIAPGGHHLLMQVTRFGPSVLVKDGPAVNRHKPSVDVLFRSVAKYSGKKSLGIILTGMGDDGAKGIKEMHDIGARTIAQNEDSCVVYGMPREAISLGAIDEISSLEKIPQQIVNYL